MKKNHLQSQYVLVGLALLLGYVHLVFQTIWFRQVQIVSGNAQTSLVMTLIVYFLGGSIGSWWFDLKSQSLEKLWSRLSISLLGLTFSSLVYFVLPNVSSALYTFFKNSELFDSLPVFTFSYATLLFLLPAIFIGSQLPILISLVKKYRKNNRVVAPIIYGGYSLSSAIGVMLMGFVFPFNLGFIFSYSFHLMLLSVITIAVLLTTKNKQHIWKELLSIFSLNNKKQQVVQMFKYSKLLILVAFLSGFLSFSLELVFIRLLSLVIRSSLFSISVVSAVFIVALSIGAFIISWFVRKKKIDTNFFLYTSLITGLYVATVLFLFAQATDWFSGIPVVVSQRDFLESVVWLSTSVFFLPLVFVGLIFPAVLTKTHKKSLGLTFSSNLLGVITGLLLANFFLLPILGIVKSLWVISLGYIIISFLFAIASHLFRLALLPVAVGITLLMLISNSDILLSPDVLLDMYHIRAIQHTNSGPLMVVDTKTASDSAQDRRILLNNYYTLGGNKAKKDEQWQTHLPLLLHPQAERVYYIGMGTGMTAVAAKDYAVSDVLVTELLAELPQLSQNYFNEETKDLFSDERFEIKITDGRTQLALENQSYDVIISDLFNPWSQGISDLYSYEHFSTVRDRLNEDGLFVQWIPVHEWKQNELLLVLRTMNSVFDQVTLWRGNFSTTHPVIGVVGQNGDAVLPYEEITDSLLALQETEEFEEIFSTYLVHEELVRSLSNERVLVEHQHAFDQDPARFLMSYYITNISKTNIDQVPEINTLDKPLFELLSTKVVLDQVTQEPMLLSGREWLLFQNRMQEDVANTEDPYLANLSKSQKQFVDSGDILEDIYIFSYWLQERMDNSFAQQFFLQQIRDEWDEYQQIVSESS